MKKTFASVFIAATAFASLQGCMAETGDAGEAVGENELAACSNDQGTNATIAALAVAMAQDMHRWQVLSDFYIYVGYNNQEMLGITQAGKNACGGSCPTVENLLLFQDSRRDQKLVMGGVKVSSWNFASRLVSGYRSQQACTSGRWCPFVAHTFDYNYTTSPGICGTNFTFGVKKPASLGGGTLSTTEISQLKNALHFVNSNGFNDWIDFTHTNSTVSIDPNGQMTPPGTPGAELCNKFSTTNINGTPCTCAVNNVSNGQLKNDDPGTPKTYYCRQLP
jgi:hypothetical protein